METKKTRFVTIEIHTFKQLIEAVPEVPMLANGVKRRSMPTEKSLRESAEILVQRVLGDHTITVYANGYFEVEDLNHYTIYPVSYLKSLIWYDHNGNRVEVTEKDYDTADWCIPLLVEGGHRLERNAHLKEVKRPDAEKTLFAWDPDQAVAEAEEEMHSEKLKRLAEVTKHLTGKQKEVVCLYYFKNMNGQAIADCLGISKQAVKDRLDGALKKLKKKF